MFGYAGCYFYLDSTRSYLPLVKSSIHTTIFSDRQQTTIQQTFTNSTGRNIKTCKYSFPIYECVSVTGFTCEIDGRKLKGIVKEKEEAKADFDQAVQRGQQAGLLEQSDVADVFSTSLGNVEAGRDVLVTSTYIGELKTNLDSDSIRLTIPTHIAPRYGNLPDNLRDSHQFIDQGMDIKVDVIMPKDKPIQGLESPSHPICVSLGRLSTDSDDHELSFSKASATLSANSSGLEKDFVFLVNAKETGNPAAILQTHSTLKNHRALMLSLVPKFSLPSIKPEIVFVADRSGSMGGSIHLLQQALTVFLKSLPSGVKFNICSFGTDYKFLWSKSKDYTKKNLDEALKDVKSFDADFGGTQTLQALEATIKNRFGDIPLEIILLTDGDIWDQDSAFSAMNKAVVKSKNQIRLFPLGIGGGVSHALIEGLARAGNGFAQAVQDGERMDNRVVRMLKAALTPHISNYSLEIKYDSEEDDFELIEAVESSLTLSKESTIQESDTTEDEHVNKKKKKMPNIIKSAISLFNPSSDPDKVDSSKANSSLPDITTPKLLQAPNNIPSLYSFSRTTVYVLMSPETIQRNPIAVILKADSETGPLRLEVPVTILDTPGDAISQLAARKAVQDLEEQRGWIYDAVDSKGKKVVKKYPSRIEELVEKEAVRLGTTYSIANKWCSFVAVDPDSNIAEEDHLASATDWNTQSRADAAMRSPIIPPGMKAFQGHDGSWSFSRTGGRGGTRDGFGGVHGGRGGSGGRGGRGGRGGGSMPLFDSMAPLAPPMAMQMSQRIISPPGAACYSLSASAGPAASGPARNLRSRRMASPAGVAAAYRAPEASDEDMEDDAENEALTAPSGDARIVHGLINQQDFLGFWAYEPSTVRLLGRFFSAHKRSEKELKSKQGTIWVTALVVAFLQIQLVSEKDVWELVVEKALAWLERQSTGKEDSMLADKHVRDLAMKA